MSDSPFLILGSGSAGSTLLAVMLDAHPLVACGPELGVFNKNQIYDNFDLFRQKLPEWLKGGLSSHGYTEYRAFFCDADLYGWDPKSIINLSKQATDLRHFFDLFFGKFLTQRKKKIWGEQTPGNAYCVREFLKLYPKARIIHIIRDGRDVFCSLSKRVNSSRFHSASAWLCNTSAALVMRGHPNYMEVYYEKLVSDPRREMERICAHLGIGFDEGVLHPNQNMYWRSIKEKFHRSWSINPTQEISSRSVGRYKKEMTDEQLELFYRVRLTASGAKTLGVSHRSAAELMKLLGYASEREILTLSRQINFRDVIDELQCGSKRVFKELILEKRLWKPFTTVC